MFKDGFTVVHRVDGLWNRSVANIRDSVIFEQHTCPAAMVRPREASFGGREGFLQDRRFVVVQEKHTMILNRFTNGLTGALQQGVLSLSNGGVRTQ